MAITDCATKGKKLHVKKLFFYLVIYCTKNQVSKPPTVPHLGWKYIASCGCVSMVYHPFSSIFVVLFCFLVYFFLSSSVIVSLCWGAPSFVYIFLVNQICGPVWSSCTCCLIPHYPIMCPETLASIWPWKILHHYHPRVLYCIPLIPQVRCPHCDIIYIFPSCYGLSTCVLLILLCLAFVCLVLHFPLVFPLLYPSYVDLLCPSSTLLPVLLVVHSHI